MNPHLPRLLVLAVVLLAGCAGSGPPPAEVRNPTAAAAVPPSTTALPVATPAPPSPTVPPAITPLATRTGADYVLRLPREDALPADWAMSPQPDFIQRSPQEGATYRFACRDLPARSIGIATVGYRHLDGLPSVAIEYVIYPTAEDAAAALADMRAAAEACGNFTIGTGDSATTAAFIPLPFPELGDEQLAALLTTSGAISGELVTQVVKVRRNHVIIGVSHSADAASDPPDTALTRTLIEVALGNLRDGPLPAGPRVAGAP